MKTSSIIEGMTILEKYRDEPDGFNCGAVHDMLYVYATDEPVVLEDLKRLVELGWFQDDYPGEEDFEVRHYDPDESWACFT